MSPDLTSPSNAGPGSTSTVRAVRHHLPLVLVCLFLGVVGGYLYAGSQVPVYTSTSRVLVDPSVGNPYVPSPSSVRQDELASLETEAQVVRSEEVLSAVLPQFPGLSLGALQRNVQVVIPPNTQVLDITFASEQQNLTQPVADAVAKAFLANRARRSDEVNQTRISRVESRTNAVMEDLRRATADAQSDNAATALYNEQLSGALRNELVSLRAQRTALENSESPTGDVIGPAGAGKSAEGLTATVVPLGVALVGLALGCLLAVLLERSRAVVRSTADVAATGVPVLAAAPASGLRRRDRRRSESEAFGTAVRRLRAAVLELEPRPDIIAVAPPGPTSSDGEVPAAIAESFAKAGHRVVLVRTDGGDNRDGVDVDDRGLAQALLFERVDVRDLLRPSVEPLLSVLSDGGFDAQSRELLVADRVRAVLSPLVRDGYLIVIQAPGVDSAEGEAFFGAADLGIVVVRRGRSQSRTVRNAVQAVRGKSAEALALVVGARPVQRVRTVETGSVTTREAAPTLPLEQRDAGGEQTPPPQQGDAGEEKIPASAKRDSGEEKTPASAKRDAGEEKARTRR
ncbi:hypothetical protein G5V58_17875 [Nocardioides anomalus]|uniref:Polysaccharide chain length determinant N-terminal domain-containing protein n=1 Tax=Nocardioides anomalus TaxID=2712223 RepID=A0A6G6WGW4_9ACTN|nr:Wzz/FepE/Etk N-terminal domain-containing protein [Nocardioides anomalus]QIG44397.1 hypothetical protein G5V58_17875 [Nocardioides anomalus]